MSETETETRPETKSQLRPAARSETPEAEVSATSSHERTRVRLQEATSELAAIGPLRSLNPERELSTTLDELHEQTLAPLEPELREALSPPLAAGLVSLALAQLEAFPGNLFWDFDLIAATVVAEAKEFARTQGVGPAAACIDDRFERMARLQHLYGRETAINFSYVHDFVYGYDWAKWVAREPELHEDVPGPFSLRFLLYMEHRGEQLLELIANDDQKYPTLPEGRPRNPFEFSREPEAEVTLHAELAKRELVPVPTWDAGALTLDWSARWREPFQERRVEVARELGLVSESR